MPNIKLPDGKNINFSKKVSGLEIAEKIIRDGIEKKQKSTIKEFGEIRIIDGPFGPYIKSGKKNYKIPKGIIPESLDEPACQKIIAASPSQPFRGKRKKKS